MLLKRRIVDSLRSIVDGIGAIGTGDYASRIESSAYSDVNLLVNLLNDMSASILAKNSQLVEATALLEHRVAERTEELSRSLADLQKAQERLIETGKLSALGLLAAGMAHELNTPLGAILSSNRNVIDYIEGKIIHMRDFYRSLTDGEAALYERAIELGAETAKRLDLPDVSRARQREIRERLDSMGAQDPSAVTEHLVDLHLDPDDESLRPLLIEPRADLVLRAVSDLLATRKMAEIIDVAGKKASTVVSALRLYLSPEREDMEHEVDIPQSIENILTLMHNMLKHGVIVRRNFSAAKAKGSADKLGQVWMNIIRNAAQAMDYKGELIIETGTKGPNAVASFIDSGPGIPDHVLARIFEPFFTTKKQGEGMGLGLDICRRIVEAHNGRIEIDARPGRTEFRIILPSI
jgi:signal transduction histidine kinase